MLDNFIETTFVAFYSERIYMHVCKSQQLHLIQPYCMCCSFCVLKWKTGLTWNL